MLVNGQKERDRGIEGCRDGEKGGENERGRVRSAVGW